MKQILLAAADWQFRALVRAQLIEEGYEVTAVPGIEHALFLLIRRRIRPDLVIVDTVGQSVTPEHLADLRRLLDDTPALICTGVYQRGAFDFTALGFPHILVRPFRVGEVVRAVRQVIQEEKR